MATGVREVSVRRGLDPRDFPLVVAGGAGPIHAAAIARELEIPLLDRTARVLDFLRRRDAHVRLQARFRAGLKTPSPSSRWSRRGRADDGARWAAVVPTRFRRRRRSRRVEVRAALDLRYVGQWHELTVAVETTDPAALAEAFHAEHDRLFGYASPEMPVEALAVRVSVLGLKRSRRSASSLPRRARGLGAARRTPGLVAGRAGAARDAGLRRAGARARVGDCGSRGRRAREHDDRRPRRLRPVGRPLRRVRARLR